MMKKVLSIWVLLALLLMTAAPAALAYEERPYSGDLGDFLGFYEPGEFTPDTYYPADVNGGKYASYYYQAFDPEIWIDLALSCYEDGYGEFRIIEYTEEELDGETHIRVYYEYTGSKKVSAIRFREDDPHEAHLVVTADRYPEFGTTVVGIHLVKELQYEGAAKFK